MMPRYAFFFAFRMALLSALVGTPSLLLAQTLLPSFGVADTLTRPCVNDTTQDILSYAQWEAYQTLDDRWDGPRDTLICIELPTVNGSGWVSPSIPLEQIDPQRPVFLRVLFDDDFVLPLGSDNLYTFAFNMYTTGLFDTGNCPGGPCTGAIAAVRIPDSTGTGTDLRWYEASYELDGYGQFAVNLCVPTEKFATNELREFVVSMKAQNPLPGQVFEGFWSETIDALAWGSLLPLRMQNVEQYRSGPANYYFEGFGFQDFLVMHADTLYPSLDHVFHLDLSPEPDPGAPTEVTAYLAPYSTFQFQPFTQLRGGLVAGSDSLHHPLTVVNDGGDLCMGFTFIEIVWVDDARYIHRQGHVEFAGSNSCFMFQPGSTLEVAPGSTFHYGREGRGMLALINGSSLQIGTGGELAMHGTLVIKEAPGVTESQDWLLTLGQGQRLSFAPGSRIHNAFSIDGRMKLVVTLDGGSIDISGLDPEDRQKVVVKELPKEEWSELRVLGNPAQDELVLSFAVRDAGAVELRAIDGLGRLVMDRTQAVAIGENRMVLPIHGLRHGVYILELSLGEERRVVRFVKD